MTTRFHSRPFLAQGEPILPALFARSGPTRVVNKLAKKRPWKQRHRSFEQAARAAALLRTLRNFRGLSKLSEGLNNVRHRIARRLQIINFPQRPYPTLLS